MSNFKCYEIDPKVNREFSMKLLEQILALFVRLHTFPFAKDVREKHKSEKQSNKNWKARMHGLQTK